MTKILLRIFITLMIFTTLQLREAVAQQSKIATLVVGNDNYIGDKLYKAVADAEAVAVIMGKADKNIQILKDADAQTFTEQVDRWRKRVSKGGTLFFYFAGHGITVNNSSRFRFIKPSREESSNDIASEAAYWIDVKSVIDAAMDSEASAAVFIIDACRSYLNAQSAGKKQQGAAQLAFLETPAVRSLAREVLDTKDFENYANLTRNGIGKLTSGEGRKPDFSLHILYSAPPGTPVDEGEAGRNSPYAASLIKHLGKPNIDTNTLFMDVARSLDGKAPRPWDEGSRIRRIVLFPQDPPKTLEPVKRKPVREQAPARTAPKPDSRPPSGPLVRPGIGAG